MSTQGIKLNGAAGPVADYRNVHGDEVRRHIVDFLAGARTPGSNQTLSLDASSLGLTWEYNGTWTFRFQAEVRDANGNGSGRRWFDGRYEPEQGGIWVRERTHEAFRVNYYKDTCGRAR